MHAKERYIMKQICVIILLLTLAGFAHAADRVQNVKAQQSGNRMALEYDLSGDRPATVSFVVTVRGQKLTADKLHLEGDYGKNVAPGRKRLVWNVLQDYPRGLSGEVEWSLTAGGGGGSDPTTGMEFVEVPEGCFRMGDLTGDGSSDEKPVHEVCVSGFSMGKYEVTNAQYRQFKPGHNSGDFKGNSLNGDSQPVVNVSWDDAVAFAEWLSRKSGTHYRLPTEAEWEYAARGGTSARNYWGDGKSDACGYANVHDRTSKQAFSDYTWEHHDCSDGYSVSAPIGSFRPNGFGLYDMMGNVWEWCSDWYGDEYFDDSPRSNPQGPSLRTHRVIRGGSWDREPAGVRASFRHLHPPDNRGGSLGFRLVSPVQ